MDIHIQNLLINSQSSNPIKDYQAIIGVVLTIVVMVWVSWLDHQRWLKNGYLKRKTDLEIEIRQKLLKIKDLFYMWNFETTLKEIDIEALIKNIENNSLSGDDRTKIDTILRACDYIKAKSQDYTIYEGHDQRTSRIKEEFNLKSAIEDYMPFAHQIKDLLNEYKDLHRNFAIVGEPMLYSVLDTTTMPYIQKNYTEIFESNRDECINLIKAANKYQIKTVELIKAIETKFKIKG